LEKSKKVMHGEWKTKRKWNHFSVIPLGLKHNEGGEYQIDKTRPTHNLRMLAKTAYGTETKSQKA